MIVWSGKGYLSVLILLVAIFVFISILPETYATQCFAIPLYIAGIFSYFFGIKWNKTLRIGDNETGNEINSKNNHSLFWVNMEYWGLIFPALALVMMAQVLDKPGTELYLNIFIIITGIAFMLFVGINLFKIKNSTLSNSQLQRTEDKPKLSFIKEEMATSKFDNEDHNQYLPK
jgi:hypothetical protein